MLSIAQPDLSHLMNAHFIDDLKAQDVAFRSLTEAVDTEPPIGPAIWQMVGIFAELERSLIQERTKAGRAAVEARGVKMGCKRIL